MLLPYFIKHIISPDIDLKLLKSVDNERHTDSQNQCKVERIAFDLISPILMYHVLILFVCIAMFVMVVLHTNV